MTSTISSDTSSAHAPAGAHPTPFPTDFLWGGAISNVQAEGGSAEGGKGPNVYDTLTVTPEPGIEPVYTDSTVASDHYHRFREDFQLLADMGVKAYRFSVVWSRIFPRGDETEANEAGLAFYEEMIDELLAHDIEPVVSLLHFDMPDWLRVSYNGFGSRATVTLHTRFVAAVVERFRTKVRWWITYNEINTAPYHSRLVAGSEQPFTLTAAQYEATIRHNTLLAHSHAAATIRRLQPDAHIGCMIYYGPVYPATSSPLDVRAARLVNELVFDVPLEVMVHGAYPQSYRRYLERRGVTVPASQDDDKVLREGAAALDYIAFSYYQTAVAVHPNSGDELADEDHLIGHFFRGSTPNPHVDRTAWGWQIDPEGLRTAAAQLYSRYRKPVFIVENGIGLDEEPGPDGIVHDDRRIEYHRDHIRALAAAIDVEGVPVLGYLAWSPFDFLSSHKETRKRYGFIHVNRTHDDLRDLARTPKASFSWYRNVINSHGAAALQPTSSTP